MKFPASWFCLSNCLPSQTSRRVHRRTRVCDHSAAIETLETRTLLTAYIVDTNVDSASNGAGVTDGLVSLREAINAANTNAVFGDAAAGSGAVADTISFAANMIGQAITLDSEQLLITDDLIINGLGSDQLKIDANSNSRVIAVQGGADVTLIGLTITGGNAKDSPDPSNTTFTGLGGGILNDRSTLRIEESLITANTGINGGGITNYGKEGTATLTIVDSTISLNNAQSSGGLLNWGESGGVAVTTISGTTIDLNTSSVNGGGAFNFQSGAIFNATNSTISNNSSGASGGGLASSGAVALKLSNTTISNNNAVTRGGGIYIPFGTFEGNNLTITGNRSDSDGNGTGDGGGIYRSSGTVEINNTIVAGNFKGTGTTANDIDGTVTGFNNLIGDATTAGGLTDGVNNNIVGVSGVGVRDIATILDTNLVNNGGTTKTHALVAGSVAINAGDNAEAVDHNSTDQRGSGFARIKNLTVDIGAVEGVNYKASSISGHLNGDWWVSAPDPNNAYSTTRWAQWPNHSFLRAVVNGDFNGDGLEDVAAWLPNGEWRVGLALLSGDYTYQKWIAWRTTGIKEIHVADFNGDGKDDIVALFKRGTKGDWWVAQSSGTNFVASKWGTWGNYNGIEKVLLGQFDGINSTDIGILTTGGAWWMALNANGSFINRKWTDWSLSSGVDHYQVGDFDGNGKDDIAGLFGSGLFRDWQVALSTGNSFVNRLWAKWKISISLDGVVAGDFNGDGATDIAGLFNDRDWWVGLANTNKFTNEKWAQWNFASSGLSDIHVGSSNGDRYQDIFARRDDNGQWKSLQSVGTAFATKTLDTWSSTANWEHVQGSVATNENSNPIPDLPSGFGLKIESKPTPNPITFNPTRWVTAEESVDSITTPTTQKAAPTFSQKQEQSTKEIEKTFGSPSLLDLLYSA